MSSLTKELEDDLGRIKKAIEKHSVNEVIGIRNKYDAAVKSALQSLPSKINCSSLVKDELADSLLNSNIKMLVTDGKDGSVYAAK